MSKMKKSSKLINEGVGKIFDKAEVWVKIINFNFRQMH